MCEVCAAREKDYSSQSYNEYSPEPLHRHQYHCSKRCEKNRDVAVTNVKGNKVGLMHHFLNLSRKKHVNKDIEGGNCFLIEFTS